LTMSQGESIGRPISIQLPSHAANTEPVVFDSRSTASEVWIHGGEGAELRLPTHQSGAALLLIRAGAPRIHLRGVRIAAPIHVEGGYLNVSFCTFHAGQDKASRFLYQSGGELSISDSAFMNASDGAILLTAGNLNLRDTLFRNNSAKQGGAIRAVGGHASISRCRFELNSAARAGGALVVEGGIVTLQDGTLFIANRAPIGGSIQFTAGAVSYSLPAPLARYLFVTAGDTINLNLGAVEVDYPFACPGKSLLPE
jgi:predicted outer membrane repeat protein